MCARPISSSRALLRVRTCELTHRKRLAPGVLAILLAIDRYRHLWLQLFSRVRRPPRCPECLCNGVLVKSDYLQENKYAAR